MKLEKEQLERVAGIFRVFGDATRLAILQELKEGELGVSELVERLPTSQANISKQLKMIYEQGLLKRRREGVQIKYEIADEMVFEMCRLVCQKISEEGAKLEKIRF